MRGLDKQLIPKRYPHVRGGTAHGISERLKRWLIAEKCAELTDEGVAFLAKVLRNEPREITQNGRKVTVWDYTTDDQFKAIDRIFDRAFGKPITPVQLDEKQQMLQKIIHEVRWLPPDPNDHSKIIEPEP
jgi:hypothetical protein